MKRKRFLKMNHHKKSNSPHHMFMEEVATTITAMEVTVMITAMVATGMIINKCQKKNKKNSRPNLQEPEYNKLPNKYRCYKPMILLLIEDK